MIHHTHRYETFKHQKLGEFMSREVHNRRSIRNKSHNQNSYFINNSQNLGKNATKPTSHFEIKDITNCQPQKLKRGSTLRKGSKSKYAESMGKFRKEFLKEASSNYYQVEEIAGDTKKKGKKSSSKENDLTMENDLDI